MTRRSNAFRTFGALSGVMKDHLYAVGSGGRIYTSPWIVTEPASRPYATILLGARGAPFELAIAGAARRHRAVVLRQMTRRGLRAVDVRLLSFQIDPSHALFPRFRAIGSPGLLPLPRELFAAFDERLDAAYCGALSAAEAAQLHEAVTATVLPFLPPARPPDRRVREVIHRLWREPDCPLGALAAAVGLSYYRLSHLFVESMGMPLRLYQQWRKVQKAIALFGVHGERRLTDVAHASGFTDSSHMCKAFVQVHGAPPSYFLDRERVTIVSVGRRSRSPARDAAPLDQAS